MGIKVAFSFPSSALLNKGTTLHPFQSGEETSFPNHHLQSGHGFQSCVFFHLGATFLLFSVVIALIWPSRIEQSLTSVLCICLFHLKILCWVKVLFPFTVNTGIGFGLPSYTVLLQDSYRFSKLVNKWKQVSLSSIGLPDPLVPGLLEYCTVYILS